MRRLWITTWHTPWARALVGIAGFLVILVLIVVLLPPLFVEDDSLEGLKAQNEVRTTLLQGLAGMVLLVGVYFTWRQLQHTREQLHTAQEGQITERFTRAIDHLGHAKLDVRLGGIYALERIARDSPADRVTIGEVLTAFIRGHAPWGGTRSSQEPDPDVLETRAPDVAASLTVLGRGAFASAEPDVNRLDLHSVDLRRATLLGAHLERANLLGAHLENANLTAAHLEGAQFWNSHLEGAFLEEAHLEDAVLESTNLRGAYLPKSHLDRAVLWGVNLEGANLRGAHLEGARADERTSWPAGFDWRAAGVTVEGEDAAAPASTDKE